LIWDVLSAAGPTLEVSSQHKPNRSNPTESVTEVTRDAPLIAVVDDDESVRRALKRLLRSAGFNVATFGSGVEFLQSLRSYRPACLVLDLNMPRMSGFDLQEHLARTVDPIPIVIVTANHTPQSRDRVMHAGAAAFLHKPVDGRALIDAVVHAISRTSA
jgi:FixJ family two-component response regulator